MTKYVFLNNKFLPESKAHLSLFSHALHYGTGCFEGIRAYFNKKTNKLYAFRMEDHYRRLLNSAKVLFINLKKSPQELSDLTKKLLLKNKFREDVYIRPVAFKGGDDILSFNLPKIADALAIVAIPMGHFLNVSNGITVGVSSWRRVNDNTLPVRAKLTGSYINTSLAKTEALLNHYDEAIFLTENGHLSEGSAENIFIIKNGQIFTPSVADDILEGITRNTVMTLLSEKMHFKVTERSIDRTELYQAEEVFLVGTGAEITPVIEVDRRAVAGGVPGKITRKLQNLYFDIVRGNNLDYKQWLFEISS